MNLAALRRPSLVRRLILLAAGWSLAVLVVAGAVLTSQFEKAALNRFDRGLAELQENIYAGATIDAQGRITPPVLYDPRLKRGLSGRYWQIAEAAPNGGIRILARSDSLAEYEIKPPDQPLQPGKAVAYDTDGPQYDDKPRPLRASALMIEQLGQTTGRWVFMAAEERTEVDREAKRFAATTAIALVMLGLGLVAAVFIQVRIGLQPMFALRREVAEVRKGKVDHLSGRYPVELSPLAEELNALVAHNQEVVERQRTHVGNLAHALKTPLSVMLAEAHARPGPLAEVVSRQASVMHEQVDHHLRRARAAARSQGQRERTALAPVLDELAMTLERIFRDRPVTIDWRAADDLHFEGERQDLLEIIGNVMENACKWSAGNVRVLAEARGDAQLAVAVEDDGPGLPQERRQEVLKRGARLDEKTPGSGLGLSIVDELARAYGGAVTLDKSSMGGLKVEIVLPRAAD